MFQVTPHGEHMRLGKSSKLAGSLKSEASEIMFWTSETILVLVRSDKLIFFFRTSETILVLNL